MPYQEPIARAIRLVHIQNLLDRNSPGLSSADLAHACAVTVRTIQRDLGLPPYSIPVYEEGRRWHIPLLRLETLWAASRHRTSSSASPRR